MHLLAGVYLANKPDGVVLAFLVVAAVLFGLAGIAGILVRAFYATGIAIGLLFFVLAFLVSS